jgi:hypothetical protein
MDSFFIFFAIVLAASVPDDAAESSSLRSEETPHLAARELISK